MAALRAHAIAVETGESRYAVRLAIGDHVITGDEAVEAGGGGLGPAPFGLLSAALAECTAMTVRSYAHQKGWPVGQVSVSVAYSKKVLAGATSPVDYFEKTVAIRGDLLTEDQRSRLLEIAAQCPLQRTLERQSAIETRAGHNQPSR